MSRFQILSLIGGGIRGAFITAFLDRIEQKLGRPIAESFDLIAGTSTGGIIAAGLAMGMPAAKMHDFYVRYGSSIFTPRPKYKTKSPLYRAIFPIANWVFERKTGTGLDSAFRARFCPHTLQKSFDEGFGERTMGDVDFTRLIIPSVNLTNGKSVKTRTLTAVSGLLIPACWLLQRRLGFSSLNKESKAFLTVTSTIFTCSQSVLVEPNFRFLLRVQMRG
jgi:patatin-like phospholipase/acyl hydrolase